MIVLLSAFYGIVKKCAVIKYPKSEIHDRQLPAVTEVRAFQAVQADLEVRADPERKVVTTLDLISAARV